MNYTKKIDGKCFEDGKARAFVPYKGWYIIDNDGVASTDRLTKNADGPLKITSYLPASGNWHLLFNLLDKEGNNILSKGVRHITYHKEGFYILEDNNEDELVNRGDVKGGFHAKDYIEKANIVFEDGRLLSDEWYDKIVSHLSGYFKVIQNGQVKFIDYNGEQFLPNITNLICFNGSEIYYCQENFLFKANKERKTVIKELKSFNDLGRFRIGQQTIILENTYDIQRLKEKLSKMHNSMIIIDDLSSEIGKMNILTKEGFLLFDEWYDRITWFSGIAGTFLVKKDERWCLVNVEDECLNDLSYDKFEITDYRFIFGKRSDGKFDLISPEFSIIGEEIESVMWADRGVWGMNIFNEEGKFHYYNGQGGDIIDYAHEVLISNANSFLILNNGKWIFYDDKQKPIPLFSRIKFK